MTRHQGRPSRRFVPRVEALEGRIVPASTITIFEATGANAAAIQTTVDNFRNELGTDNGAQVGSFETGRRQITWDGGPDALSAPLLFPPENFNVQSPRGVVFSTPGSGFQVSMDNNTPADPDPDQVEFDNLNPTYSATFGVFSAQRLFTPIGSNVTEVAFFVPGTVIPAVTRGFGVVFTDVDLAGSTKVEYFDAAGNLLQARTALANSGAETLSFLGVSFDRAVVASVRITSGNIPLGADDDPANNRDAVAMDDFIYGEPVGATIVGVGAGLRPLVHFKDPLGGATMGSFFATVPSFKGGVRLATGDVDGDNITDIIVGLGKGIPNEVRVFSGRDLSLLASFSPYEEAYQKGVYVGAGDFDGDSALEVVVGPGNGRAGEIRVFNIAGGTGAALAGPLGSLLAYPTAFKGGVQVAVGDFNGDLDDEIIAAPGAGPAQRIKVFAADGTVVRQFFAFSATARFQQFVAVADLDGDNAAEIIVGVGSGAARVRIFNGGNAALERTLKPFAGKVIPGGVRVAAGDINGDGSADLLFGVGAGGSNRVQALDGTTLELLASFFAFDTETANGVFLADFRPRG